MKRRSSRGAGTLPVNKLCHEKAGTCSATTASNASANPANGCASCSTIAGSCSTPSNISDSESISPRSVGSAAKVPSRGCAAINCCVVRATSAVDSNRRPARSKNGPPSGRHTARYLPGWLDNRRARVFVASSASSGVAPSTTTAIRSARCGKAASKTRSRLRQARSSPISLALSVSIAMCPALYVNALAASAPAITITSQGRRAQAATMCVVILVMLMSAPEDSSRLIFPGTRAAEVRSAQSTMATAIPPSATLSSAPRPQASAPTQR